MGWIPYQFKMRYKDLFFMTNGKTPSWGNAFAQRMIEFFS
jgi:hypothetical protein